MGIFDGLKQKLQEYKQRRAEEKERIAAFLKAYEEQEIAREMEIVEREIAEMRRKGVLRFEADVDPSEDIEDILEILEMEDVPEEFINFETLLEKYPEVFFNEDNYSEDYDDCDAPENGIVSAEENLKNKNNKKPCNDDDEEMVN